MCFRPPDADMIEHRCPACGTNNLPEATMCANCFSAIEPLSAEDLPDPAAPSVPSRAIPSTPKVPNAPKKPGA